LASEKELSIFDDPKVTIKKNIDPAESVKVLTKNSLKGDNGFVRLMLNGPKKKDVIFTCLGHKEYPNIFTDRAMHNSKTPIDSVRKIPLPEKPWVPEAKDITLSYFAESSFLTEDQNDFQFFHVTPFGYTEKSVWEDNGQYLLPQLRGSSGPFESAGGSFNMTSREDEEDMPYGYLFIGLKDLRPAQKVSILFQMDEGSGNSDIQTELKDINWYYLSNNDWIPFSDSKFGPDRTVGMNASGIISFMFTADATTNNTILPKDVYWLCAANVKDPEGVSRSINVHTQGVLATYMESLDIKNHYNAPLSPGTIKKLLIKDNAVKKVDQLYPSFYGETSEQFHNFYQRCNERLRHRNRCVERWDYEHLILNKFPDVYKVKCLNKTGFLTREEAGSVALIVVPDLRRVTILDKLEPRLHKGVLANINKFLRSKISRFISITAQNPIYEQIRVHAKVRYHRRFDPGQYTAELNRALVEYLAPWVFDSGVEIVFGGIIYKSEILDFIEERYYIDKVSDFWIEQITHGYGDIGIGYMVIRSTVDPNFDDEDTFVVGYEVNVAKASTSRSVLTSVKNHALKIW
jgi:hypothetical protein